MCLLSRLAACLGLLVAGCEVGPEYQKPAVSVTDSFKEATPADYRTAGTWATARPGDDIDRGKWWEIFGDRQLDRLEDELTAANQTLQESEAHFREARALIRFQRAAEFPAISVGASADSVRDSANQPYFQIPNPPPEGDFQLPFDLSYEIDLWGRIHRMVEAAREEAQASAADLATASLSLHAELALDYVELRAADAQQRLMDDTVKAYTSALRLTMNRHAGGFAPESDVEQAQTQLDTIRVQDTDIGVTRSQFEHAIAVLIGEPPAALSLMPAPLKLQPRQVLVSVPSELLQRRPDIAAAERRVAESNEQIGIAQAAYYPSVDIGATSGFEGTSPGNWFVWPSLFWAVGPSVSQPLFDGGRIRSQSDATRAAYDAGVAAYRETTLTAFQQVEDNLAALRILGVEAHQQRDAVAAANRALQTFTNLYIGGEVAYLQVITAQTTALSNERNQVDIERRRMEADIRLVKALGGGWDAGALPGLEEHGIPPGAFVPLAAQTTDQ
jgi:NodT family efflux transporter outer membrane factor (OMF) lipoprotein